VEGDLCARAGRQKPVRRRKPRSGEQARGPQHEVKPAASTHLQPAGRAAHVTAKATSPGRDPKRAGDCGGVWGAARVQGQVRNVRGPSARPLSGQARSYKPKAKSSRAQRESEGIVVPDGEARAPTKAVRHNAAGGKGPCGGHAEERVSAREWPARPDLTTPTAGDCGDKVRQLQRQLWAAAKRAPGRRFHALYGQMCRGDVLHEAWKRVRRNKGAAGVDRVTISQIEQYGVRRFLQELGEVLRAGEYGAQVVRRAYIPKADGAKRPLGIPTVQDRVVQMAAKLVLEPIYEADFAPSSYGFRPTAQCAAGAGAAQATGPPRRRPRAGCRHRELLRQHRARQAANAGAPAGQRPEDAQAGEAVAAGRGDGRRGGEPSGGGHAAGWRDLAAAVEHLPARAGPGVGQAWPTPGRTGAVCGRLRGDVPHGAGCEEAKAASSMC
jgi:hypothetical protein